MKDFIYATKGITYCVKQINKRIFLKKILLQYKIAVFLSIAVLCAFSFYIVNIQAVREIENLITSFRYFIFHQLHDTQNELLTLQEVIALHSYAIASSSCFLLGYYFISRKFN
jgi:hypothetical protein